MEPQSTPEPSNQATPPVGPSALPPVPTPAVTPPPQLSPAAPAPGARSSHLGVILGSIAGVFVLLVVILALGWFLLWSPAAQAKHLSNNFMHNITTGDVAKAVELTGDSSSKDFLTNASKKVAGAYSLTQSKFTNGTGYYLYDLTGAADKYARTVINKDANGKRVVHSFVFSNEALALVPSSSSTTDTTTENTDTTAQSTTKTSSATGCLTANDFSFFSNIESSLPDPNANGTYSTFYQLQFNPNDATYLPGGIPDPTTVFNDFKNFYAQNANKKFAIELEASVNSATPDPTLANARNAKVQSDLENISGIPASKITIDPITNDTSGQGESGGDAFYRQVQIMLRSDYSCAQD